MDIDILFTPTPFSYIKSAYRVPAEMYREVAVSGRKGVIVKDMGNYIGVYFYDAPSIRPFPCHPTYEVEYLETFNNKPAILKISASKKRYMDYLDADSGLSFKEWLGIKTKKHQK